MSTKGAQFQVSGKHKRDDGFRAAKEVWISLKTSDQFEALPVRL